MQQKLLYCDKWTLLKHYKILKGNMQVRTWKSQTSATNSRLVLQWYTQIDVVYYNKLNTCWNCMTLNDKLEWAVILLYNVSKSTRGNCMTQSLLVSWNVSENFITWLLHSFLCSYGDTAGHISWMWLNTIMPLAGRL